MSPEQHDDLPYSSAQRRGVRQKQRRDFRERITGNRRSLQLTGLILILFLINLFWSSHNASIQSGQISAACNFWRPLAPLPVTVVKGTAKPTRVSVTLIAGARDAYARQCPGKIPPADPSLVKWAAYYHVPLP